MEFKCSVLTPTAHGPNLWKYNFLSPLHLNPLKTHSRASLLVPNVKVSQLGANAAHQLNHPAHPDLLAHLDNPEDPVNQETLEDLANLVNLDNPHHAQHKKLNALAAHLDLPDHLAQMANPVDPVNLEILVHPDKVEDKDLLVHPVHLVMLVLLVMTDNLAILVKMEHPELVALEHPDQKDLPVNPAVPVNLEVPANLAALANLVMLDLLAHLVNPVDPVNLEVPDNLVAMDFLAQMLLIVLAQGAPLLLLVINKLVVATKRDAFKFFVI